MIVIWIIVGLTACAAGGGLMFLFGVWKFAHDVRDEVRIHYDMDRYPGMRDRWLVDHFGPEGAARWLLNRQAVRLAYSKRDLGFWDTEGKLLEQRAQKAKRSKMSETRAAFEDHMIDDEEARRLSANLKQAKKVAVVLDKLIEDNVALQSMPDEWLTKGPEGETRGLVWGDFGGAGELPNQDMEYSWCPPWGDDSDEYGEHSHELKRDVGDCHAEPSGTDYMAAGYFDYGWRMLVAEVAAHRWSEYWVERKSHMTMPVMKALTMMNRDKYAKLRVEADQFIKDHCTQTFGPEDYTQQLFEKGERL
jgi:hypothetical protein